MQSKNHTSTHPRQGAALLIAVAILAILTVFAVVFSIQSRVDMDAATNFSNNIRADLMADAAVSIAISVLDANRDAHPTITALDQAAFTYFNGTWIAGKQWAFPNRDVNGDGILDTWLTTKGVVPQIFEDDLVLADADGIDNDFDGVIDEAGEQATIGDLGQMLYVPRAMFSTVPTSLPPTNAALEPFLIFDPPNVNIAMEDNVLPLLDANSSRYALRRGPVLAGWPGGHPPTRAEQLDSLVVDTTTGEQVPFTDVDNNGDGLRDSMWIPIPADSIFGGIDQDGDGETDGVDNNGDGTIDEAGERNVTVDEGGDGIDNDLDGEIDEAGEIAAFVYWGGNDGRDNDNDGNIDDANEQGIFLTAPLVVTDRDNLLDFNVPLLADGFLVAVNHAVLLEFSNLSFDSSIDAAVEADNIFAADWDTIEYSGDIDLLDNDFDIIVNNDAGDTFNMPFDADNDGDIDLDDEALLDRDGDGDVDGFEQGVAARRLGLNFINTDSTTPFFYPINPVLSTGTLVAARGEPVCFVAGRVAILVTDESSKVNIDVAGAHGPNEHFQTLERFSADARRPVRRALSQGIGTYEYDLRVLPGLGTELAGRMFNYRMGISNGLGLTPEPLSSDKFPDAAFPQNLDISLPGYGGVDDNMSSLWMAVNGLDDDGDAQVYQNDGVDNDLNGLIDEPGEGALVGIDEGLRPFDYDGDGLLELANFEGTDEPGEFQLFRPLRNVVLEETVGDEDEDSSFEEFGEASDRVYHARDQVRDLSGIGVTTYDRMRNLVTAHSLDGSGRYQYYSRTDGTPLIRPLLNGLKLNLNYSMAINPNNPDDPGQLARMFIDDWYYPPSTEDAQFEDLRGQVALFNGDLLGVDVLAQEQWLFMTGLRQEDSGAIGVPFYADPTTVGAAPSAFGAMTPDQELRALRLGATLQDFRDPDHVRTESSLRLADPWWIEGVVAGASIDDTNGDGIQDFIRQIEYKTSGIESIRINEIMVRPVRRIEAEGTPGSGDELDPNQFLVGEFDYDFTPGTANWLSAGNVGAVGERTVLTNATTGLTEIAQFTFRPSVGLPPGRYYLTVNITDENGNVSVLSASAGDIDYAIKYVSTGVGTWPGDAAIAAQKSHGVADIIADEANGGVIVPWRALATSDFQVLPLVPINRDTGLALLSSEEVPIAQLVNHEGYQQNGAFTVEVPPFAGGPNPTQVELIVALRRRAGVGSFSINYFEFSQDPDHEYLEIVNIEEPPALLNADNIDVHAINLSGWEVEVGDSNTDSNAVIMRIPDGTLIAPGDTLLLAVNKYDGGIDGTGATLFDDPALDAVPDIFKNGIGMVRGPRDSTGAATDFGFGWVTEPPIPRINPVTSAANGYNTPLNYAAAADIVVPAGPFTGASVFFRPVDRETVDSDGNGDDDYGTDEPLANFSLSTPESEPTFGTHTPTAFGAVGQDDTNPGKAWDRIIQLEILNDDVTFAGESRADIADLVLRGGVFPNYPELDGVDNDGDDGYLSNDAIDNDGDNDQNDGFDADNDGINFGDEEIAANFIDDDRDGFIDELVGEGSGFDELFEGYDEGFVRRYIRQSATPLLSVSAVPGSYDDGVVPFTDIFVLDPATNQPDYVSNFGESPDWKAFVERRFYPGDNVIVTLYDGPVGGGRVVDRVTYNQRDVENVAIDDDVDVPVALEFNAGLAQAWPPNTMGLDFYRSLERKHPLYAGDRYGTRNRWTATDGNYDDWSRGTNRFDELITGTAPQFLATTEADSLFAHGLSGSPLRMNFYQRVLENANGQFNAADAVDAPGFPSTQWMFDKAKVRNRNLASAGDLMTMSHLSFAHNIYDDAGVFDVAFEATPFRNDNLVQLNSANPAAAGPLVGMDFPKDLEALLTSTSFDEVNLSVGQADFYPLYPAAGHVAADDTLAQWLEPTPGSPAAPRAWSPVFLYPLGADTVSFVDDFSAPPAVLPVDPALGVEELFSHLFLPDTQTYPFHQYFMFQPAVNIGKVPAGTLDTDMEDRWPLDRRAVAYVSANPQDFNPNFSLHNDPTPLAINDAHPSEALFVWQGEDALQNGRYDAYVVTMDNLDDIAAAHIESGETLLTAVGAATVGALDFLNPQDFGVDIEFFTDLNGDRRCWDDTINRNGLPDMATSSGNNELENDLNGVDPNPESYGRLDGMVPSRDGIIYYGAVEVKNNYLALFIRNWAASGAVNRITRVVLTPRRATNGRINMNTAVTQAVPVGSGIELFNPMMGIPGAMLESTGFVNNSEAIGLPSDYNDIPVAIPGLLTRPDAIIAGRQERGIETGIYNNGLRELGTPFALLSSQRAGLGFFTPQQLQYPRSLYDGNVPALAISAAAGQLRFEEMQARLSLMANFVTTRSDVFEILVTAQPGYVSDNNGDGDLNWRDDNEFVPTGEIKRRVIYERSQGDPDGARQ